MSGGKNYKEHRWQMRVYDDTFLGQNNGHLVVPQNKPANKIVYIRIMCARQNLISSLTVWTFKILKFCAYPLTDFIRMRKKKRFSLQFK